LWQAPLHRLAEERQRNPSIESLIEQLLTPDWIDRFVARQILVQRGEEAIFSLQAAAYNNNTPHKATLVWVLDNLHTESGTPTRAPVGNRQS
ncbi:MAG TPA: hypothetical protein P5526_15255, partial [Anaerolineae bacterium]|nr:hypothetical protein [Anaerolineae bacterium]